MKEIRLAKGHIALVDDEDYDRLSVYRWRLSKGPMDRTGYAMRTVKRGDGANTAVKMHREIMNAPSDLVVDHVDGNGLNNQKSNLRVCTRSDNMHNMGIPRNNSSGAKGVHWNASANSWEASIRVHGKRIYLGVFRDKAEAAMAYDRAALRYHGEFAQTNRMFELTGA